MLIYQIHGNPTPWAAPQRRGEVYFNPKHQEKEQAIWQLRSQFNHEPLSGPLDLSATFYMPIPESTSSIRKKQMLNGIMHHIKKPDRSNLLKFVEDCLEKAGIISNDSIIVSGQTRKLYGLRPMTVIQIESLSEIQGLALEKYI